MKSYEKQQRKLSGSESHGQVCHRCGWVYPNPHPSAKHRRAHRKHCAGGNSASVGGGAADALKSPEDGDASDRKKNGSDEENSDEDPKNQDGEVAAAEEEMKAAEEPKADGEVRKSSNDGMLVKDAADDTLEADASQHDSNAGGLEPKQTIGEVEDLSPNKDHIVSDKADIVGSTEDAKKSCSPDNKRPFLDVSKEKNSSQVINNVELANDEKNEIGLDFHRASILPVEELQRSSAVINSKLPEINDCIGVNETSNHDIAATSPTTVLRPKVSKNMIEFDSHISIRQYEHTNVVGGRPSQEEEFCTDGLFTLEINPDEKFYTSCSSIPEAESGYSLRETSITTLAEVSESKPECCEGSVGDTIIHVTADAGAKLANYLEDENTKVPPSELVVLELDTNGNVFPSTVQVNDKAPPCNGSGNVTESANSGDVQLAKSWPIDGERSQLVDESQGDATVPVMNSKHSEGLRVSWLENQGQRSILGSSENLENDLDGQDTSSHRTSFSSAQSEELTVEFLSQEQHSITTLSHKGTSANFFRAEFFDNALSNVNQSHEAAEMSIRDQLDSYEEGQVNDDAKVEEPRKEILEKNCSVGTEKSSEGELHIQEQKVVNNTDISGDSIKNNGLHSNEGMEDQNGDVSLQFTEVSPRYMDNIAQCHIDRPIGCNAPEERKRKSANGDCFDHCDKQAEPHVKEAKIENNCQVLYERQNPCKIETQFVEHTHGSQLELQNISKVRIVEPALVDDRNTSLGERDFQIPNAEKENIYGSLNEELHSNASSEIGLVHDEAPYSSIEERSTAMGKVQLFIEDPSSAVDSKDSSTSGVAPSISYLSIQGQEFHVESKQHPDSYMQLMDNLVDSNSQTINTEGSCSSGSGGLVQDHAADAVPFLDAVTSPLTDSETQRDLHTSLTDSETQRDLHTSDLATEVVVLDCKVDSVHALMGSSVTPAEPGERSAYNEIQSIHNSKNQPQGTNNEEDSAKVAKTKTEKSHVMLKSLLAEANNESKKKVISGEDDNDTSSMIKKTRSAQNGQPLRTWSPSIASEKSNGSYDHRADHKEWNSPARLPISKHEKKKIKGKQGWIPFICCPSNHP